MREKKIIHDDDMINASAEADLDYVLNDRAAKYLYFSEDQSSQSDLTLESKCDSQQMRFDEQYSIKQVFKPEEDGRDKLVISVVDSGIGISRKDKLKLFKLFGCLS